MTRFPLLGADTSEPEVTNISMHGIWLLADGQEHFLAYDDFPWFREAPARAIFNVEEPNPGHFYWPELDVDLGIATIRSPKDYPLIAAHDSVP
jgi:hypothetical protein